VLGRSNAIWCPYADDPTLLEQFDAEKKARQQANWRKVNLAKKLKKQQQASS
jgi:ribosome-binding protein aMBF1 (putative translation factor)